MKMNEELQSGMLYLSGFLDRDDFSKSLTSLAETMIKALISYLDMNEGFAVIGLGAFGAYELNIGSDLDLLFVHEKTTFRPVSGQRAAEELIRMLSSYTEQGFAYRIDMRLRPDGSKGILANDLNRYKRYYLKSAEPWEIQSLLRARPVAGSKDLSERFRSLQHQIIKTRAAEISGSAMRKIRKRIIREIARESDGYDLKNGPGGIKEIEFLIQFLQLKHVTRYQELLTENTITALERLKQLAILNGTQADFLLDSYRFMKTLDTLLRLNDTTVLKTNSEITDIIIRFLRIASGDELIRKIRETRKKVIDLTEKCYG
jgi:glutamate-ammonia-ligase adenylyltransferase